MASAMRAPVAWEPVKNTPSTRCASSAAPTSPAPTSGDEHVARHAGLVQQPRDLQAGQGGELRRLVEHRVARQQRRHEDVAADELGVVPGRDVGRPRRAARARCAPSSRPRRTPSRWRVPRATSARKKSMRRSRPLSSLRDCRIGLPISAVSVPASGSGSLTTAARKRAKAGLALLRAAAPPSPAARARAALGLGGDAGRVVGGDLGERSPVAGLWIRSVAHEGSFRAARAASRKSASSAASSRCRRRVDGIPGAIGRPPDKAGAPVRRIASITPSSLLSGLHGEARAPGP